jgi:hypothetical protein
VAGTLTALVGALMGIEPLGVWAAIRRSVTLVRRRFALVFPFVSLPIIVQAGLSGTLDTWSSTHPVLWALGSALIPLAMLVYVGLVTVTLAFEPTGRTPPDRAPS